MSQITRRLENLEAATGAGLGLPSKTIQKLWEDLEDYMQFVHKMGDAGAPALKDIKGMAARAKRKDDQEKT